MEQGETPPSEQNNLSHEHTDQPMPESNAKGPSTELTTQAEWKQWLGTNIENFWGDVDVSATLMAAFTEGKDYVYEKLTKSGLKSFVRPSTVILLDRKATPAAIGTTTDGQNIFVKKYYLEKISDNDIQATMRYTSLDGTETIFEGTTPDRFRLAGVEETHHAAFIQLKKGVKGIDPNSTTVADYDAREVEYRALKWQLRYAQERQMPEVTINVLRDRLAAAKPLRAKRQK